MTLYSLPIPLSVPTIDRRAWEYVQDCLDTGWISSSGKYVGAFEEAIAQMAGTRYAVATASGTAALHLALLVAGIRPGDGVIVPNLTFVASVNAVRYLGAIPILIDVCADDWQLDLDLLDDYLHKRCVRTSTGTMSAGDVPIRAILPVHVLGNLCDVERLLDIARRFELTIVEDATEALGSRFNGRMAGSFGLLGTYSFNGNKILSTGGGGMIVTDQEALARRARHLSTQAKTLPSEYHHDETGFNYRLVNVLAAIGLAQAEGFDAALARRQEIDRRYRNELAGIGDIRFARVHPAVEPNAWLTTFATGRLRALLDFMTARGIECRPLWMPMKSLPMYADCAYVSRKNVTKTLYDSCISIPSSGNLTEDEQTRVIECVEAFYEATS